jgi:hypothetical protein
MRHSLEGKIDHRSTNNVAGGFPFLRENIQRAVVIKDTGQCLLGDRFDPGHFNLRCKDPVPASQAPTYYY